MVFRNYITVKGEVKTYPKYNVYKRSQVKTKQVKCPVCGLYCLKIFHRKFGDYISLGYICNAHTPSHVFIDGKYKIFDVEVN